jgi:deoxyribonuclease-4
MIMSVRFGPAGIPIQCSGHSTVEGVRCCADLGLNAMEMEFVRGVRMKDEMAKQVGKAAKELNIALSSHAPYYINFCTKEEQKMHNNRRHLFNSAQITHLARGRITVFHPGFYLKSTPEEAYSIAKQELSSLVEKLKSHNIKTILGAETVGKKSAFGSLHENIKLAQEIEQVEPVIDFAHLLARGDFKIAKEDDYRKIFGLVEKELPDTKHFHCHFSEINYTDKGERNHLPLGTNSKPPFKPLMKVLSENGYNATVICESPELDHDALLMQKYYSKLKGDKNAAN